MLGRMGRDRRFTAIRDRRVTAIGFALFLERVSRRLFAPPPKPVTARWHRLESAPAALGLERPLYAARRPPSEVVFIPQDEYFERVERVLESV